jgi:hypothetical protein
VSEGAVGVDDHRFRDCDTGLHQLDGRSGGEAGAEDGDGLPGTCHGRYEVERG